MNKARKIIPIVLIIIMLLAVIIIKNNTTNRYSLTKSDAMDTTYTMTIIGNSKSRELLSECSDIVKFYDSILSPTHTYSTLYKLNENKTSSMRSEIIDIIEKCESFYIDTNRRFDITIGALSEEWNRAIKAGEYLTKEEADKLNLATDYQSLVTDRENKTVTITKENQRITLGAVAKGFIADKLSQRLSQENIKGAMINLGGNIYVSGEKEDGSLWNIAIQDPKNQEDTICTLTLSDKFIITSGDYQRYADIDAKRYHHIIDATTAMPADTGLNSVTIVCNSGFLADALSTACFLSGLEEGKSLSRKYNTSAIFVCGDEVHYSKELKDVINTTNNSYKYYEY